MKKTVITLLSATTILFSCQNGQDPDKQTKIPATEEAQAKAAAEIDDPVTRGRYLVEVMDCGHCHSPKIMTKEGPAPDPERFMSGHPANEKMPDFDRSIIKKGLLVFNMNLTAFAGPWGTSYSANLTPHATGIGNWEVENFKKAMRHGKLKGLDGSRSLLPPMPWQAFAKLTDADLEAMFAYLKTLKPVDNLVPEAVPPS